MKPNRSARDIRNDIDYLDYESEGSLSHKEYVIEREKLVQELEDFYKTNPQSS